MSATTDTANRTYECVDCGDRVRTEDHLGACPSCGGRTRNIAVPRAQ